MKKVKIILLAVMSGLFLFNCEQNYVQAQAFDPSYNPAKAAQAKMNKKRAATKNRKIDFYDKDKTNYSGFPFALLREGDLYVVSGEQVIVYKMQSEKDMYGDNKYGLLIDTTTVTFLRKLECSPVCLPYKDGIYIYNYGYQENVDKREANCYAVHVKTVKSAYVFTGSHFCYNYYLDENNQTKVRKLWSTNDLFPKELKDSNEIGIYRYRKMKYSNEGYWY